MVRRFEGRSWGSDERRELTLLLSCTVNTGGRLASRFDFSNFSDDRKSDSGYIDGELGLLCREVCSADAAL